MATGRLLFAASRMKRLGSRNEHTELPKLPSARDFSGALSGGTKWPLKPSHVIQKPLLAFTLTVSLEVFLSVLSQLASQIQPHALVVYLKGEHFREPHLG